jgi:sulfate adenylyltransferase
MAWPAVVVDDATREAIAAAGGCEVIDSEGATVCRVLTSGGRWEDTVGPGTEISWREVPPRPWDELHLRSREPFEAQTTVVIDHVDEVGKWPAIAQTAVVLAATTLDGASAPNDLVRAVCSSFPGRVVVVPLHRADPERAAKRAVILNALGLAGALDRPEQSAEQSGQDDGGGVVLLLSGLSGSGKSTIARTVANRLIEDGHPVTLLDGDRVRHHLSAGLGFSVADRDTNVLRIGWVAAEIAHHGGIAICSPIAPHAPIRAAVRQQVEARGGRFVLVHVATPLEECERRDRKGLYARARRGEIPDFTGISAPYDVPVNPDLRLDTTGGSIDACAAKVRALIDGSPS